MSSFQSLSNYRRQRVTFCVFVLCILIIFAMLHYANSLNHGFDVGSEKKGLPVVKKTSSSSSSLLPAPLSGKIEITDDSEAVGAGSRSDDDYSEQQQAEGSDDVGDSKSTTNNTKISRRNFPKFPIPSGLDQVVLNSYAYKAATHWWFSGDVIKFHRTLREEANRLLRNASTNSAEALRCKYEKNFDKYYYTHRKPRPKELGNVEMAVATRSVAAKFVSIGEPLHRVVNPHPVQLSGDFDLFGKKFGNWHVTFVEDPNKAHSSPQRVPAEPEMSVALFRHAIVSYGNVVTCHGSMFTAGGCLWEGPSHGALAAAQNHEVKNIIAVALCDGWCRGYYHFSHEHLPRIAMVHDLLVHNPHARLVLSHSPVSFAKQFYTDILGIPKEKILVAGGNGLKAGVVALPTPMRCGNAFTSALVGLRRIVLAKVVPQFHPHHLGVAVPREDVEDVEENEFPPTYTRNNGRIRILFAERAKLSRMPRNWDELKNYIKEEFARVAEFEETQGKEHAREQVLRFYRSDIVLGPHGANLANIMFMRPGRHVLEMASAKDGNLCYYSTAMRVNLTHHLVLHDKGKDSHYTLTKEILKKHLQNAIEAVKDLTP